MRISPHELAIHRIAGDLEDPGEWEGGIEEWHQFLVKLTGEDFGMDAAQWREWFAKCDRELISLLYDGLNGGTRARRNARELSWDEFIMRLNDRGESL